MQNIERGYVHASRRRNGRYACIAKADVLRVYYVWTTSHVPAASSNSGPDFVNLYKAHDCLELSLLNNTYNKQNHLHNTT